MMEYKVRVTGVETIPLRRAESGMHLARSVTNRDGQLIVKGDRELTSSMIMKLERFRVRRVAIEDEQERWVTEEEYETRYKSSEIVDERTVEEPAGKPSLSTDLNFSRLRQELQVMERLLRDENPREATKVRNQIAEAFELSNELNRLQTEVHNQNLDRRERNQILSVLREKVNRIERSFMDMDVFENLLFDTVETVNDRERLRTRMIDSVEENREDIPWTEDPPARIKPDLSDLFERLQERLHSSENPDELERYRQELQQLKNLEDRRDDLLESIFKETESDTFQRDLLQFMEQSGDPDTDKVPPDVPGDDPENQELLESVEQFTRDHEDLRTSVMDDSSSAETRETGDEGVNRAGREFQEETHLKDTEGALKQLQRSLTNSADEGRLEAHRERLRDLDRTGQSLRRDIEEKVDDSEIKETLMKVLSGDPDLDPDELDGLELSEDQAVQMTDWINKHSEQMEQLHRELDTLDENDLDVESGDMEEAVDRVRNRTQIENLEKMKLYIRSPMTSEKGTDDQAIDLREDRLEQAISENNAQKISRYSDLPQSTVESVLRLFELPEKAEDERKDVLSLIEDVLQDVLYRGRVNTDCLDGLCDELRSLLSDQKRPFSLLMHSNEPRDVMLPHSFNCAFICFWFLRDSKNLNEDPRSIILASITLDVGLTVLPETMVFHAGEFSERIRREYRKHPLYSEKLVGRSSGVEPSVVSMVSEHHERVDGSGYPQAVSFEKQDELSPLVQVVDRYTRSLENRVDQPGVEPEIAMERMMEKQDKFEGSLIKKLSETVGYYPNGTIVILSDGRLGLVRNQSSDEPTRPQLFLITDKNQNRLNSPEKLNLSRVPAVSIKKSVRW